MATLEGQYIHKTSKVQSHLMTDRHTYEHAHIQTHTQTDTHTHTHTHMYRHRQTDRHTHAHRHNTHIHTYRQTDRHTHTTHTLAVGASTGGPTVKGKVTSKQFHSLQSLQPYLIVPWSP